MELFHEKLKTETYEPGPVRRVEIQKPDGGQSSPEFPRSGNRVVRQAVVNVTEPIFDPAFHPSVYGYRPKGSQHHARAKAGRFINRYDLTEVADMDLGKCSDTLDHGIIIDTAAERISNGRVPAPTRKFLKSGVMKKDTFEATGTGSCQGWVISPLLSNIYLNKFDQKMMSGGIRIVRHADDIPIFAIDKRQAGNCMRHATKIPEQELKLKALRKYPSDNRQGLSP